MASSLIIVIYLLIIYQYNSIHTPEVLNRPEAETVAEVMDDSNINEEIQEGKVTNLKIKNAIKDMKNGIVAGIDNITVEIIKDDIDTTVDVLHDLLNLIWEEERIPEDWCKGLHSKLPKKGDLNNCGNWRGRNWKETRRKTVEKERMAMGFNSWIEAGLAAANRESWRSMIFGPIPHTERRN